MKQPSSRKQAAAALHQIHEIVQNCRQRYNHAFIRIDAGLLRHINDATITLLQGRAALAPDQTNDTEKSLLEGLTALIMRVAALIEISHASPERFSLAVEEPAAGDAGPEAVLLNVAPGADRQHPLDATNEIAAPGLPLVEEVGLPLTKESFDEAYNFVVFEAVKWFRYIRSSGKKSKAEVFRGKLEQALDRLTAPQVERVSPPVGEPFIGVPRERLKREAGLRSKREMDTALAELKDERIACETVATGRHKTQFIIDLKRQEEFQRLIEEQLGGARRPEQDRQATA